MNCMNVKYSTFMNCQSKLTDVESAIIFNFVFIRVDW